jgi:hypothetical protein
MQRKKTRAGNPFLASEPVRVERPHLVWFSLPTVFECFFLIPCDVSGVHSGAATFRSIPESGRAGYGCEHIRLVSDVFVKSPKLCFSLCEGKQNEAKFHQHICRR